MVAPKHPGVRWGGRAKGTPNKVTKDAKAAFQAVYEGNLEHLERWLHQTAETDPAKAADLLLRMARHFLPVLASTQHSGEINIAEGLTDEQLIAKAKSLLSTGTDSSCVGTREEETDAVPD